VEFLDSQGQALLRSFEAERAQASEALEFEQAAKIHRRIEKVNEVLRQRPELMRNLRDLDGVVVQRGAEVKTVTFFPVTAGELHAPVALSLDENVPAPIPLDKQLHALLERSPTSPTTPAHARKTALAPWEHLSLLARWYYSSFREGELVMWGPGQIIPHARLIRVCRKMLATAPTQPHSP
jgi:hypothetical protein